ncbi:MAG TPA: hypothetical protein VF035_07360 [Longimicrobiales bacterium]
MRRLIFAAACLVMAATPFTAAAQGTQSTHDMEIRRLREQMDSLAPRLQAIMRKDSAQAAAKRAADSIAQLVPLDTVAVGPFLLVGKPAHVRRTRGYFEHAWETWQPQFAGLDSVVRGRVFMPVQNADIASNLRIMSSQPGRAIITFPRTPDPVIGRNTAEMALAQLLKPHLAGSIQAWSGGGGIGLRNDADRLIRYIVVPVGDTLPDARGRHCMEGDIAACRDVLGLPAGKSERGDPVRTSFLNYVLDQADAGAVAKNSGGTGDAGEELEKLGGAPLDTLLRGWIDGLTAERASEAGTAGHRVLSTLAWVMIFGALSMRSTRWRLG